MKESYLHEAYLTYKKMHGIDANFLFTGAALADAIPLAAFAQNAKQHGVDLGGIVLDPFSDDCDQFLATDAINAVLDHECLVVRVGDHDAGMVKRSIRLFFKTLKVLSKIAYLKNVDQKKDIWTLDEPFFLLAPSDGYISPFIVEFLFQLDRPIVYVFMDDGTGAYVRNNRELAMRGVERIFNPVVRMMGTLYVIASRPFSENLQNKFEQKAYFRTFTLFRREGESLVLNENIKPLYRAAFHLFAERSAIKPKDYSNVVLIAATKAELFGLEDTEIKAIRMIKSYCDKHGLRVVLRPHPLAHGNERYDSLGIEIEESSKVTPEVLFSVCDHLPVAVVGFASAAQINANIYFDVPSLSMEGLVKDDLSSLRRGFPPIEQFCTNIDRTRSLYSRYIEFPANDSEFEERIAQLAKSDVR